MLLRLLCRKHIVTELEDEVLAHFPLAVGFDAVAERVYADLLRKPFGVLCGSNLGLHRRYGLLYLVRKWRARWSPGSRRSDSTLPLGSTFLALISCGSNLFGCFFKRITGGPDSGPSFLLMDLGDSCGFTFFHVNRRSRNWNCRSSPLANLLSISPIFISFLVMISMAAMVGFVLVMFFGCLAFSFLHST